ncbi:MAG: efflux RND transporter periplasmic adaptor subunit [Candidatus Hydrogenedentes bacterium]|nr:efflux RND transporter periplasmic adaptor subunit [Candidatus Hydrogenedentota bacterium]
MKKALISLLICVVIAGIGAAIVAFAIGAKTAGSEAVGKSPDKTPNVKVQVIKTITLDDSIALIGSVVPWESVVVSAELGGKIELQGIEEGDLVKSGQEIFRIDTDMVQSAREQAAARNKLAAQEFERQQRLTKGGMSTPQARDRAEAERDVAAADLRAAHIRVDKSVVTSPMNGVVDKVFKKKSEFVDVGMPMARIVQVHKVKVTIGIPERDIGYFAVGNPVTITADALPQKTFTGKIYRIGATAEEATHTFVTEVELDNADRLLKPGMVARAALSRKTFPNAVVVPIFSVISLEDRRFVFTEENGLAHIRPVQVGILQGSTVQVTQGLSAGDRLIVVGQRDARDGEPVRVQEVAE